MSVGQSLYEGQLSDGKAAAVSNRANASGEQNVSERSLQDLLSETNSLLRRLVAIFEEVHADEITSGETDELESIQQ